MSDTWDMLPAEDLHELWGQLSEHQRLAFLGSLTEEAAQQLLSHQTRLKEAATRPPSRSTAPRRNSALAPQPVAQGYPTGDPDEHWTDAELVAFIAHQDAAATASGREQQRGVVVTRRKA